MDLDALFHQDFESFISRLRLLGENKFEIDNFRFLIFEDGSVRLNHIFLDKENLEVYLPYFSDKIRVNINLCLGVEKGAGSHRLVLDKRYTTLRTHMVCYDSFSEIYGDGIDFVEDYAVHSTRLTKLVFPNCLSENFSSNGLKNTLYLELKDFSGTVEELYYKKLNYFMDMIKSGKAVEIKF